MRRQLLALILVVSPLLVAFGPAPQTSEEQSLPFIYFISTDARYCTGNAGVATGFRVSGEAGIYTALHEVAGCDLVHARPDIGMGPGFDLKVTKVDVERDTAFLSSPEFESFATKEGLRGLSRGSDNDVKDADRLTIIGYPTGRTFEQLKRFGMMVGRKKLAPLIPDKNQKEMASYNSPSLNIQVYHMVATIEHGDSGAPVLAPDNRVVGVANGGVNDGATAVTWAIPFDQLTMRAVGETGDEYSRIKVRPSSSFAFSASEVTRQPVPLQPKMISTGVVKSYRAQSMLWIGSAKGSDYQKDSTSIDSTYVGTRRSVVYDHEATVTRAGAQQDAGRTQFTATTIEGVQYVQIDGSQCARPGLPNGELDGLEQAVYDVLGEPMNSGELMATYLGVDEVNGTTAKHYLLEEPVSLQASQRGTELSEVSAGELWLSSNGYLIQANAFAISTNNPADGQAEAAMAFLSISVSDINANLTITEPPMCGRQAGPKATPATGQGTATSKVTATIEKVDVQQNVVGGSSKGVNVQMTFTTQNAQGRSGVAAVGVFTQEGVPLKASVSKYQAEDGTLEVSANYTPGYASTRYTNIDLFIPYEQLDLVDGFHNLALVPYLFDASSGDLLVIGDPVIFTVAHHAAAAEPWRGMGDFSAQKLNTVVAFVSQASEAEIKAVYSLDTRHLADYFASAALQDELDGVAKLQLDGNYAEEQFDHSRSYIRDIIPLSDGSVDVEYCEYWSGKTYDLMTDQLVDSSSLEAVPQKITIADIGSKSYITDVVYHDDVSLCAAP